MKKLFVAVLAIAAAVACNTAEIVDLPQNPQINFANAFVQNATRADVAADPSTKTADLASFNVWGFMDEAAGQVFVEELVTKSGDAWGYTNTQYWVKGHTYYFAALANYTNAIVDTAGANTYGLGTVAFDNAAAAGAEDLLYAATSVDATNAIPESPVALTFSHLLSKVKFTFTNGFANPLATIDVKNVQITNAPAVGTINLAVENWWDNNDWAVTGSTTLNFGDVCEKLAIGGKQECANECLTIPAAQDYVIEFDVVYYQGSVEASKAHKKVELKDVEFQMGKAYNLAAVIDASNVSEDGEELKPIEFTVVEVKDWVETPSKDYGYEIFSNDIVVKTAKGLQAVSEGINAGTIANNATIVLANDIDLSELAQSRAIATNLTPIGTEDIPFEGVFNGNGYAVKNFNYVADEPVYFVGLIGCAQNATVKNLVVENANVEFASDANGVGGTIGVVVGGLYGTSTLENITLKGDVKVVGELDKKGAGRIGAVVGGNEGTNNVTVKNVRVEANAGSYVQGNNAIGGIAGQLQYAAKFVDCYSNINVIAGQYFAGGIEGLSAAASTFTNCQSAGNVSVVAGRAGNANDLYRVGGITGGWADGKGKTLVLTDCSYAGTISGQDAAGTAAQTLDCAGYVGRGYAATAGSKVSVNGVVYTYKGNGVYSANGYFASNAAELQAALDAAVNGDTIILTADIEGNVVATQKADVKVTLDGAGYELAGYIVVDGKSATLTTAGITIKNVNFVADAISADACVRLGDGTNATRYACNVSVVGCTFDVPGAVAVKSYTGGDKNLVISECTATANAHSLLQAAGIDGILVEKCTVNSKNGLNFNSSNNVVINECNVDTKGYCARFGANSGAIGATEYEISNSSLKSLCDDGDAVIILRANTANSTLNLVNTTLEGEIKLTNAAGAKVYVDGVLM